MRQEDSDDSEGSTLTFEEPEYTDSDAESSTNQDLYDPAQPGHLFDDAAGNELVAEPPAELEHRRQDLPIVPDEAPGIQDEGIPGPSSRADEDNPGDQLPNKRPRIERGSDGAGTSKGKENE